ncbi:MAG: tetratricopeptide repeat protein [Cyanobacteria bacterium]|nr:tetratricopeptide repeat protein [Cyanobacteriota bacterium]
MQFSPNELKKGSSFTLSSFSRQLISLGLFVIFSLTFGGCSQNSINNKAISELNEKAQELLQKGDAEGAVGRLESARDLNPEEPTTLYNLAIAYNQKGDFDKSINAFETLLKNKKFPTGIEANGLGQSLGVVCEAKADQLITKAEEADEKKSPETSKKLREDAIFYFEKAVHAYDAVINAPDAKSKVVEQLKTQTDMIQKKIQELKTGSKTVG